MGNREEPSRILEKSIHVFTPAACGMQSRMFQLAGQTEIWRTPHSACASVRLALSPFQVSPRYGSHTGN